MVSSGKLRHVDTILHSHHRENLKSYFSKDFSKATTVLVRMGNSHRKINKSYMKSRSN
jgi:hypothetical protein